MTAITWNKVGNPNFSDSNQLQALASQQLVAAGAGLKDTAQDYQDALRKRNHGLLQEYINQAKTPEELQSESFQQGFKNLQSALKNEYDAAAMSQYKDSRADLLTKRASDQVALERNRFGLTTDQTKEATRIGMNSLLALVNDPMAYAAKKQELVDAGLYDQGIEQAAKLGAAQLKQINNANELYDKTSADLFKAPALENAAREANTQSTLGLLKIAQAKAPHENALLDAQAAAARAKENNIVGGFTPTSYEQAVTEGIANIRKSQQPLYDGVSGKFTYPDIEAVDKAILKDEKLPAWLGLPGTAVKAKQVINSIPELATLPKAIKAAVYMGLVNKVRENNIFGKDDWLSQDDSKYRTLAIEALKDNIGYIENAKVKEQTAIQDLAMRLSRMNGRDPTENYNYVRYQLGASPLDKYNISPDVVKQVKEGSIKFPEPARVPTSSAAQVVTDRANAQLAATPTNPQIKMLQERYNQSKDLLEKSYLQSKITELMRANH